MKNFITFLADGFEEVEAITPIDYLRRSGVNVYTVAVPSDTTTDKYIVMGSHKIPVIADLTLEEFLKDFGDNLPDGLFFPGGLKGAENLSNTESLLQYAEKCFSNGKIVSAICASPAVVLGKTNCLENKTWTCYPGMATESNELYINNYVNKPFVTDGNLVTARAAGAAEEFACELIRILCDEATAKKIHDGTVQR